MNGAEHRIPGWVALVAGGGALLAMAWLPRLRTSRLRTEPSVAPHGEPEPGNRLVAGPPIVHDPALGPLPLRDWLVRHSGREDVWTEVVTEFYTAAAQDPEIADYFTGVDMAALQRHFGAALTLVTGQGLTAGAVQQLRARHARVHNSRGQAITGEVFDATIGALAEVLRAKGVADDVLGRLQPLITPLREVIVVEPRVGAASR